MIIYLLRNKVNGKGYVGQTIQSLHTRWLNHLCEMRAGSDYAIHQALRKHGAENFEKCIIATARSLDELNLLEDFYIRLHGTLKPGGYNLDTGGKNHRTHPDTKAKLSAAAKLRPKRFGHKHSPETIEKLKAAARNRAPMSQETRDKIAAASSKKRYTPEQRARMSAGMTGKKRRPFSAEGRANMSAAHKGKKRAPFTAEALANMSKAQTGKKRAPMSTEARTRLSMANKGKEKTPEHRAKLSAATTAYFAKLKEAKWPSTIQ